MKQLVQAAVVPDDVEPVSKIYLNSSLMRIILESIFNTSLEQMDYTDLFAPSLELALPQRLEDDVVFEISLTTSPEVTCQVSDGGQTAPASVPSSTGPGGANTDIDIASTNDEVLPSSTSLRYDPPWFGQFVPQVNRLEGPEHYGPAVIESNYAWEHNWLDASSL